MIERKVKNITDTSVCTVPSSQVAEHTINLGHRIQLQNTVILAKETRDMERI